MTTNVNLSSQLENIVKQKVASGMYASVSEVVREGLRLLEERDQLRILKLEKLRKDIQEAINSGPALPWDSDSIKSSGRALREKRLNQEN